MLRIENVQTLPDGGPVFFEIDRRGIDIGRDSYLDWTLPDPERFISGKHCEIHYRDGGYWVHDVSTNGTTINDRPGRLTEPHRIAHGDRINIGQYIIVADLASEDTSASRGGGSHPGPAASADPWADVTDAAETVSKRDFHTYDTGNATSIPASRREPVDLAEENISWGLSDAQPSSNDAEDVDWSSPPPSRSEPASAPPAADDWSVSPDSGSGGEFDWREPGGSGGGGSATEAAPPDWRAALDAGEAKTPAAETPPAPEEPSVPETASSEPAFEPPAEEPAAPAAPQEDPVSFEVEAAPEPPAEAPADTVFEAEPEPEPEPAPAPPPPEPAPAAEPARPASSGLASQWAGGDQPEPAPAPAAPAAAPAAKAAPGAVVAAFERGAGMPAGAVVGRSDEEFAEELGQLFKTVTQNLQAMLAARAETKSAMRSSERTMIGALENNPLKFSPTPEDALKIMFGAPSRSYLDATRTVEQSFGDLQKHQMQTFGAMQQALQALIDDLDPENIAGATSKDGGLAGLVSSRRAKYWDTYVERFRAKAGRHERGMIDAFMILFSEMYDRQG